MANPYLDPFEQKIIPALQAITADGKLSFGELFSFAQVAGPAVNQLIAEASTFDATDKTYLLDAVGLMFDKYIVPIDIKFLPDWAETRLEPLARAWMLDELGKYIDRLMATPGHVGSAAIELPQ